MIQYKVCVGTIEEIERAFNGWVAALMPGVNVNSGPLTRIEGDQWFKECIYVLPVRGNGLAMPTNAVPMKGGR